MPDNDAVRGANIYSLKGKRVFVAGHKGMVGSGLVRRLEGEDCETITVEKSQVDLRDQIAVDDFMRREKPDAVFVAAARVGGILANASRPAEFIYENLAIQNAVIHGAYRHEVSKLVFLGSSCIYPRMAPQPMVEESLLTGPLEETNQWYAIAKIAGLKMCEAYREQYGCDFISAMPTNLYGAHDNFDLVSSHVLPALIAKIHTAKTQNEPTVTIWGTGAPKREFLHVDDCADALVFLMKNYSGAKHVNCGVGSDISIKDLAALISDIVGYGGEFVYDTTKADGTPRKLLSVDKLADLGWKAQISLEVGIECTYRWYVDNHT
jgi:GDP-L-fucose synthase